MGIPDGIIDGKNASFSLEPIRGQKLCLALERSGIFPDGFLDMQIWHYFLLNQALI
jgi:hypothetical protein